jgi:hypothetical protein
MATPSLAVVVNGELKLNYDRDKPLPAHQRAYLDRMDRRMDGGIPVGGETIASPDLGARARFVAAQLVHALRVDDEPLAAATCSYLANRLPDLQQVRIETDGVETHVDLVFDRPYVPQSVVQIVRPDRLN